MKKAIELILGILVIGVIVFYILLNLLSAFLPQYEDSFFDLSAFWGAVKNFSMYAWAAANLIAANEVSKPDSNKKFFAIMFFINFIIFMIIESNLSTAFKSAPSYYE